MAQGHVAFITIDALAPKLAYQLSLRRRLGVRNSTHTLVKIMQPFVGGIAHAQPAASVKGSRITR